MSQRPAQDRRPDTRPPAAPNREDREQEDPAPAILVVDDEASNLTAFAEILTGLGADIVLAASGLEALRCVLQRDFCAILMDLRMPDMDGYETAALIRQRERSRRIPVIFLTAFDKNDAQVYRGYSEGAVDFVFKPVEPLVLRAKVSVFVELYKQAQEIRHSMAKERRLLEENLQIRGRHLAAERKLRANERREAMIVRQLPIAVYETDGGESGLARSFLHADSAMRLLGFDACAFEDDPQLWAQRIHDDDRDAARQALAGLRPGGSYSVEYRWRCADDGYRYLLDQGVVASQAGSARPHIFGTLLDVQDRRMLEQQLLHAQKIDAVGKLTGGIAHDFNNMLTVVIGNLDALQRHAELEPRAARRVGRALQGALHCRDFTQRLLGFARRQALAPQVIDPNALINSLSDLVSRTLGERVEIRTDLKEAAWPLYSDPGQIESALLNLLVNARDAMPDGGRVTIRTANVTIGKRLPQPPPDLPPGAYVAIEVADTGIGMSPEVLAQACEAFYTTKATGQGTGLGLSTIHGFVRQSGGDLTIRSQPGKGTAARLYFPRHADGAARSGSGEAGGEQAELPRARKGERVLVVEDEEAVRQSTASTLRDLGYAVSEAANAASAMEVLARTKGIGLMFTDIVMPGPVNGYQLAEDALRRWPGLRILFTSAYGGDISAGAERQAGAFLRKPYRDYELAQAIRDALG
ncbi:MAG: response regulator [Sneathiellaceae bacterium]